MGFTPTPAPKPNPTAAPNPTAGSGSGPTRTPTPSGNGGSVTCPPNAGPPPLSLKPAAGRITDGQTATLNVSTSAGAKISGYLNNGNAHIARVEGTADSRGHYTEQARVSIHPSRPTQVAFLINAFDGCGHVTYRTAKITVLPVGGHARGSSQAAPPKKSSHAPHPAPKAPTALLFGVGLAPGSVTAGGKLTVTLRAAPRTHVVVFARVLPYSAVSGASAPSGATALYQKLVQGSADAHGQYTGRLTLSFKKTKGAVLVVQIREGQGAAARTARVTLLPTRHPGRALQVNVGLKPGSGKVKDSMTVSVQSTPHVQVAALIRAVSTTTTKASRGKPASTRTQTLYQKVLKGATNGHGQYSGGTALTYKPATSRPTLFTVAVL